MERVPRDGDPPFANWSRRDFLSRAAKAGMMLAGASSLSFRPPASDPGEKSRQLIIRSQRPEDFETPVELFDSWLTPNDRFYVRSHLYTPEISLNTWSLRVDGLVEHPVTLQFDDLSRFARVSEVVTIECAGNGRAFQDPPVPGVQWQKGAIGTARWGGIRLRDVLLRAGLKPHAKYVAFNGADEPIGSVPDFVRCIPLQKALHPATMLASQMNGAPLPLSNGFPLRLITPGWEGAACAKWLVRLEVRDTEPDGHFMKNAYRMPPRPVAPGTSVDPKDMQPVTTLNVKSMITSPLENATVKPGIVTVRGFAWAGEAQVVGVDVSTDQGQTWRPAILGRNFARFAWREWSYAWRPKEPGTAVILSRARDNRGRVQPVVPFWNPSGYLYNVIDSVRVNVE